MADDIPTGKDVGEGGVFQTAGGGVGVEEATGIFETQGQKRAEGLARGAVGLEDYDTELGDVTQCDGVEPAPFVAVVVVNECGEVASGGDGWSDGDLRDGSLDSR